MSTSAKTWIAVAVVLVVVIIGWIWYGNSSGNVPAQYEQTPAADTSSSGSNSAASVTAMSSATNTSDAGLNQDLNSVDGQMTGLNSDTSSADQGLNSTPTPTAQ